MTKYYSGTETAKIIRKELKREFPNTKFSVRSDYSSVKIAWFDGASYKAVDEFTRQFQGKYFNGMIDMQENKKTIWEGEEVCFDCYLTSSPCYKHEDS